jgi:hypothetical protein
MDDAVAPLYLRFRVKSRTGAYSLSPSARRRLDGSSHPPSVGGERPSRTARPKAAGLQPASCVPQVTLPRELEPSRGLEPRSARYRRAALPLSYDGVADSLGHDPNTPGGTHCLAGRHGNLTVCAVPIWLRGWRSAEESNPLPLGIHPSFQDWWPTIQPERSLWNWYARRDSNPHYRRSERRASCRLGYARLVLGAGFEPALDGFSNRFFCRNWDTRAGTAPGIRTQTEHDLPG